MPPAKPNLELTTTEKTVIAEWKAYAQASGAPPSVRYLAKRLGVYPNTITHALKKLKAQGYIREQPITATRLTLTAKAKRIGP